MAINGVRFWSFVLGICRSRK